MADGGALAVTARPAGAQLARGEAALEIAVADAGPGIPADRRRADVRRPCHREGGGPGAAVGSALAVSRASSVPRGGRWPPRRPGTADRASTSAFPSLRRAGGRSMARPRVLVVDDEQRHARCSRTSSAGVPTSICQAETRGGRAGKAREDATSTRLTDMGCHETSGLELVRDARERAPETRSSSFTAYASVETAVEAMKLGAYDYLTKPFQRDESCRPSSRAPREARRLRGENRAAGRAGARLGFER